MLYWYESSQALIEATQSYTAEQEPKPPSPPKKKKK